LAPVLGAADPGEVFLASDLDTQRAIVRELIDVTIGPGQIGRSRSTRTALSSAGDLDKI
jgi:hypothetical protein